LAAAAAAVSWDAQYTMVRAVKHVTPVAALEAGIPDAGAVVFAALGVALALHGKRAVRPRALNAACIGISLTMNALASGPGWRDLAIWVMPAGVYALASDTLIGVVRAWALARQRDDGQVLAEDGPTPLALAGGAALWLLRLVMDAPGTLGGFRSWVIADCPVAPGLRPGHVAHIEAARRGAGEQIARAEAEREQIAGRCDELVERAVAEARQAQEEAVLAHTAEASLQAEVERVRADARQAVTQALADAAREREELRGWYGCQADSPRAELGQACEQAGRLVGQVRDAAAAQVAALEQASAHLRAERDRLAAAARERDEVRAWADGQIDGLLAQLSEARGYAARLVAQVREDCAARITALEADRDRPAAEARAAARQPRHGGARTGREAQRRGAGPTKRDQMIQAAGRRTDLATVPLAEVSKLAASVAAEIGYSPGTARRELARHVRDLQGVPDPAIASDSKGGQAR
jgi:hypothetical protein